VFKLGCATSVVVLGLKGQSSRLAIGLTAIRHGLDCYEYVLVLTALYLCVCLTQCYRVRVLVIHVGSTAVSVFRCGLAQQRWNTGATVAVGLKASTVNMVIH